MIGGKLAHYEITGALGRGGMGEVFRARDSKLDREVAIKVLPEFYARDPERVARFQREAKVLASLNHPHIASIYDFEEFEGKQFLVMELVEGDTLGERINAGAMPVEDALAFAKQIAEALEAAHESGIIHRDLKPANVKVTPDGTVKVLDFGLAKALMTGGDASQTEMANSPTITAQHSPTAAGVILGTAAYMSPEQARGKPIDKRTDIWSFGCVLYECLGARRPFDGETTTDMLAKVLERDPDWNALPPDTPPIIRNLLQRCLQKNRKDRLRDIGEAWVVLNGALTGELSGLALSAPEVSRSRRGGALGWAVAAVSTVALVVSLVGLWRATRPVEKTPFHLSVEVNADSPLQASIGAQFALSPDGKTIAYVAGEDRDRKLYLRRLDQLESTALSGTGDAQHPFFSPDGKWLAFFTSNRLKKVSVSGGTPLSLCETTDNRGGTWGTGGSIVFAPSTTKGLFRVQAAGGEPEQLTDPQKNKERSHRWPQFLPNSNEVVFISQLPAQDFNASTIEVLSLDTMERTVLHRGGSYPRCLPTGHLIYVREATVYCARTDATFKKLLSTPAPVLEGVKFDTRNGGAQIAFSKSGLMAYHAGTEVAADTSLVLLDRFGVETPLISELRTYSQPTFSPDGKRLAVSIFRPDGSDHDIWIHDMTRQTLSRLTFSDGEDSTPVWTPDGREIAFSSERDGVTSQLYMKRTDGSGGEQRLQTSQTPQWPYAFAKNGKTLIYGEWHPTTSGDIWTLSLNETGKHQTEPYLTTEFVELNAALSPDGAWLAYNSNESGAAEVYVRPFPKGDGRWQISTDGGRYPVWSPDGKELYYRSRARTMVVSIESTENSIIAGLPESLFEFKQMGSVFRRPHDIAPDGKRFVMVKQAGTGEEFDRTQMRFVFNWFDELEAKVPAQ